jgi:hypothetical protein
MVEMIPHVYGGVCAPARRALRVAGSQESNTKAQARVPEESGADLGHFWRRAGLDGDGIWQGGT